MKITIGAMIIPQNGTLANLKRAWVGAEALGADRVYVSDHFFTPSQADMVAAHRRAGDIAERDAGQVRISVPEDADSPIFESMTLQAAMAVTTMRAEIGCLVCASTTCRSMTPGDDGSELAMVLLTGCSVDTAPVAASWAAGMDRGRVLAS